MECKTCHHDIPPGYSSCPWCGNSLDFAPGSYPASNSDPASLDAYSNPQNQPGYPGSAARYPSNPSYPGSAGPYCSTYSSPNRTGQTYSASSRSKKSSRTVWILSSITALLAIGAGGWFAFSQMAPSASSLAASEAVGASVSLQTANEQEKPPVSSEISSNAELSFEDAQAAFESSPSIETMQAVYASAPKKPDADLVCEAWVQSLWQDNTAEHVDTLRQAEQLLHPSNGISEGLALYQDLVSDGNGNKAFSNIVHLTVSGSGEVEELSTIYLLPSLHPDGIYFTVDGTTAAGGVVSIDGAITRRYNFNYDESQDGIYDVRFESGPYRADYENGALVFEVAAGATQCMDSLPPATFKVYGDKLLCDYTHSMGNISAGAVMYRNR